MTFRPLNDQLTAALDRYQAENFLPSRNAAINQILSRALLGNGQPAPPAPPAPAAPPTLQAAPISSPPAPPAALQGWD